MSFEEVVPGVLVNTKSKIKVSVPHPDIGWIIRNPELTGTMTTDGKLLVFSSAEKLYTYLNEWQEGTYVAEEYPWDILVDECSKFASHAVIDHEGKTGFYQTVPLRKEI